MTFPVSTFKAFRDSERKSFVSEVRCPVFLKGPPESEGTFSATFFLFFFGEFRTSGYLSIHFSGFGLRPYAPMRTLLFTLFAISQIG